MVKSSAPNVNSNDLKEDFCFTHGNISLYYFFYHKRKLQPFSNVFYDVFKQQRGTMQFAIIVSTSLYVTIQYSTEQFMATHKMIREHGGTTNKYL